MKRIIPLLLAVAVLSARADVLVYEGFHPADYNNVGDNTQMTPSSASTTGDYTVGLATGAWSMNGSMPKVYGANFGLALPPEMTAGGFSALGGSIGLNPDQNNAALRSTSHALVADTLKVSSGTLYLRMLLTLDAKAAGKLVAGASLANKDGGYYGFGLTTGDQDYYLLTATKSSIAFVVWKNSSNQYVLSLAHTTASGTAFTSYPILTDIAVGTTYLCYAEIRVGAGTDGKEILRAGAMAVDAYTKETPWAALDGDSDSVEVELMTDSSYPTRIAVAGPYGTNGGRFRADELVVGTELSDILLVSTTKPILSDGALALANGTYTATAALSQSDADVTYTLSDGDDATPEAPVALGAGSFTADSTATGTFAAPADDTTYEVVLTAENAGGESSQLSLGTIYGGTLALAKASDASELGAVPAVLTVSRAGADPLPLVVNYSFAGGTAVAGVNYVDDAGSVTIPAGETSATITVTPLVDAATAADTTMTVSLAAGNYTAPAAGVSVTIANFTTPEGDNYWMGVSATDGKCLASTAANWSAGHAPLATENVFFDGAYSSADCEWDADATATVASWTMQNGYAGTVTVDTVFPGKGDFQCLTVTGAMTVNAGSVMHPQSRTMAENHNAEWDWLGDLLANETYRLRLDVGSLAVGADGLLDAKGKGYLATHDSARVNASHGGRISDASPRCYGDPKEPIHIGLPDRPAGNYYNGVGGGAIYVTSAGAVVVDGIVRADSAGRDYGNNNHACGAAGSVYIQAASVSGTGTISAYGPGSADGNYKGTGGRVAIVTERPVDRSTFASINADSARRNAQDYIAKRFGGSGTVFFRDATMTHGVLVVASAETTYEAVPRDHRTDVSADGDWTFDRVELGGNVQLAVPAGTTLTLPGWNCVTAPGNASGTPSGLFYEGGTLAFGSAADVTLAGRWHFAPVSNYVFNANVALADGAAIGFGGKYTQTLANNAYPTDVDMIHCTVNGDLTVPAGCAVNASRAGAMLDSNHVPAGYPQGAFGGRRSNAGNTFGSVFRPRTVPHGQSNSYGHQVPGGAVELVVTGTLTLGGTVETSGYTGTDGLASQMGGGAIDLAAGRLVGDGTITAGAVRNGQPGGRIAIRLTDAGATLDDFDGTIDCATMGAGSIGSCGSVYIQTAADGEGRGTIVLDDNGVTCTTYTPICATGYAADDVADFRHASLVVRNEAKAQVSVADANGVFRMDGLEIGETGELDLYGKAFIVKSASVAGTNVPPGTYTAAQLASLGFSQVVDTADGAGGTLVVHGRGTVFIVK